MDWLKEYLGEELYSQVKEKLEGNDKVKLANLATGEYVSKDKYDGDLKEKESKITELTNKVKEFDGVDPEKFKKDIKDWETKYNTTVANLKKSNAISLAIAKAKPRNEKALMALIDTEIIKLNDDGSVTGLAEQLEKVKKENGFLFEEDRNPEPDPVDLGGNYGDGKPEDNKNITWDEAIDSHYEK